MLRACEVDGVGVSLHVKVGTDVNSAASMLVVLAVKCRELTVTEMHTWRWECTALSNGAGVAINFIYFRRTKYACMPYDLYTLRVALQDLQEINVFHRVTSHMKYRFYT